MVPRRQPLLGAYLRAVTRGSALGEHLARAVDRLCAVDQSKQYRRYVSDLGGASPTRADAVQGNKKDNITIVYTPWSNLKKDGSMAVGQVGFKDQRKVCAT
jgi:hypothetical protein